MYMTTPSGLDLLDTSMLLERELILLISSENRWFSTDEIASSLNINRSTVLRTVKALEEDIKNIGMPGLEIQFSKGKGIILKKSRDFDMNYFFAEFFSKSPLMKLLLAIFNGRFGTVRRYSYNNYISEATIRRYLVKIRMFIAPLGITMQRDTANIQGSETQIRMFLFKMYWSVYAGTKWPFVGIDQAKVQSIVNQFLKQIGAKNKIDSTSEQMILYYLGVTIMRTRKGCMIEYNPKWKEYIDGNTSYEVFKDILLKFNRDFSTKNLEIEFHYVVWVSFFDTYSMGEFGREFVEHQEQYKGQLYRATDLMLKNFEEDFFKIPESQYEIVKYYLYASHSFCYNFHNFIAIPFLESVALREKLVQFILKLERISKNEIFSETAKLVDSYMLLFYYFNLVNQYDPIIHVYFETDMPRFVREAMINHIESQLGSRFNIKFLKRKDSFEEVDLIISTNVSAALKSNNGNIPVVGVNRDVSSSDVKLIIDVCNEIVKEKFKIISIKS